jgi:hypothetical protein
MVAGATGARPLHQRLLCNRHLQPRHTIECWRGPCPLSLTGWLTSQCNPQTLTTLRRVAGWCSVPSTFGLALTGLHRPKVLHHRAFRGKRREERKTTTARSQWSPASLGRRRYVGLCGSPLVQGVDPKDRWHHGPPPHCQAN